MAVRHVQEEGQLEAVKEAVLGSMQRLTAADPAQAAALVIRHFPGDHSRVLATLEVLSPAPALPFFTRCSGLVCLAVNS